jgi:hypothetical protein
MPRISSIPPRLAFVPLALWFACAGPLGAQVATGGEVRQLVTFRLPPGRLADVLTIFAEDAIPLYERDDSMLSLRAFREVESPEPLDLVVVRAFRGMSGMDGSNDTLRRLATERGSSIGAIYGAIGALSVSHHDQFVEMLPVLGNGDPAGEPLVAVVWYRTLAGEQQQFERSLEEVAAWERRGGIPASTGRFLVSNGWTHLRFLGFESLGAYERYWQQVRDLGAHAYVEGVTAVRREAILAPVPELSIR